MFADADIDNIYRACLDLWGHKKKFVYSHLITTETDNNGYFFFDWRLTFIVNILWRPASMEISDNSFFPLFSFLIL